jgi:hypothetical protein
MIPEILVAVLEDAQSSAFEKWDAIQRIESSSETPFMDERVATAMVKLFENESEIVRHAALHLCACKGGTTSSKEECSKMVAR